MNDSEEDKGLMLYGRDVSKMPCFRNSFLYGIGSGVGSGLMFFLFTSRTQASCHAAMASFAVVTLSYWAQCRYKYSISKFEMQKTQELLRKHTVYEGTETEKSLYKEIGLSNKKADG